MNAKNGLHEGWGGRSARGAHATVRTVGTHDGAERPPTSGMRARKHSRQAVLEHRQLHWTALGALELPHIDSTSTLACMAAASARAFARFRLLEQHLAMAAAAVEHTSPRLLPARGPD
jgi:hypothetical protein